MVVPHRHRTHVQLQTLRVPTVVQFIATPAVQKYAPTYSVSHPAPSWGLNFRDKELVDIGGSQVPCILTVAQIVFDLE